jgi:pyruvate,water dikinase
MIVDLTDARALEPSLTGGKGSGLAALIAGGLPVPPGFVITTRAFDAFIDEAGLRGEIEGLLGGQGDADATPTALQGRIGASTLPPAVAEALEQRLRQAESDTGGSLLWAVRSSAVAEDLADASFAGQYDTILGLAGFDEVAAAVLRCWASFFNPGSLEYRRSRRISDFRGAVVVQRLIPSHAAGVCFTLDPLTGDSDCIVINSSFGLGESVVGGRCTPDTFVVARKGWRLTSRQLATKETKVVPRP